MAIADMGFTGRIANLIYYKMYGKTYVRTVPSRVKQTKATKARAGEFGRASSIGRVIRGILFSVIHNPTDKKMQTRLVSAVFEWLQSVGDRRAEPATQPRDLKMFQFADQGPNVQERWKVNLQVINPSSGLVQIKIPAFVPVESIVAPSSSVSVICRIATGICDVASARAMGSSSTELVFDYNSKQVAAQTITLNLPTPKGSLVVTGVSLEYKISKNGYIQNNSNKAYMPTGIVHAVYI
jgi:hypothetical protein